ncbi:hypothetical protein GURKE_03740 [Brevundimonas phage vB_BpoS-Gurke]|uniref:Uncharacterized protein n=1 Tax=Brevundimonas phage vB_BpoS-Gurke TaxID=2948599 RepID=A0A9E7N4W4_9CAUD|nr:hypothetical protein GURKE_03740 [Brevundimonas phage vB_BpoS-Gurke]
MCVCGYSVYGGEMADLAVTDPARDKETFQAAFRNPQAVVVRGVFPTWEAARDEWKAASWQNVDNALMRFFIRPITGDDLPPVAAPNHFTFAPYAARPGEA